MLRRVWKVMSIIDAKPGFSLFDQKGQVFWKNILGFRGKNRFPEPKAINLFFGSNLGYHFYWANYLPLARCSHAFVANV